MAKGKNANKGIPAKSQIFFKCECGFQATSDTKIQSRIREKLHKKKCDTPNDDYYASYDLPTGADISGVNADTLFSKYKILLEQRDSLNAI